MSAKKQALDLHYGSYSFSGFDEPASFRNVNLSQHSPSQKLSTPLKQYKHLQQYEMERENVAPNMIQGRFSPSVTISQIRTVEFLEQEVRRLEEVIFYVGTNNDKLIIQCDQQQREIAFLKVANLKVRQESEAEIRKLKELLNDKISECQSIDRNAKRQKEMIEKQNERIKAHIKSVIQKKNDQIFNINREREVEVYQSRKILDNTVEGLKATYKKEIDDFNIKIARYIEEISNWKEKLDKVEKQYQSLESDYHSQKMKQLQQNDVSIRDLKQKYYRNKLLMLQASQQQIQTLSESSQIQRNSFLLEIEKLKEQVERRQLQNKQLREQEALNKRNYEQNIKDYQPLVNEFRNKLLKVHIMKQQQIEVLKVKTATIHEQNLRSVQETYASKVEFLSQKIRSLQKQIEKLHDALAKQLQKNGNQLKQMRAKESKNQEELAKMKLMYEDVENLRRQKMFSEKSVIMQQSAQIIKNYQIKSSSIQFYQEELRKLRKHLDDMVSQSKSQEKAYNESKVLWERERQQLLANIKVITQNSEKEITKLREVIEEKINQIDQLTKEILKNIRESPLPDYSKYIKEIEELKKMLAQSVERQKLMKDKCEKAQKKSRQFSSQFEHMQMQNEVIINEAKGEWDAISQRKIYQIEQFYKKKMSYLESEKEQLKKLISELEDKITNLLKRQKQLESALSDVMIALQRKSQLQHKLIMLGTDNNLVKNKAQLFEY